MYRPDEIAWRAPSDAPPAPSILHLGIAQFVLARGDDSY